MSRLNRYTQEARQAVAGARAEALRLRQRSVGAEHLLLGILKLGDPLIEGLFSSLRIDALRVVHAVEFVVGHGNSVYARGPALGPTARVALAHAERETAEADADQVGVEHLLLGLYGEPASLMAALLESFGVHADALRQQCRLLLRGGRAYIQLTCRFTASYEKTPALNRVSRDLTLAALAGELDPLIGREAELERTMQILARRSKNNPALLGHAGVGKTAIAEGLALRIIQERVPENLLNCRVVALDIGLLPAGTRYRGELEEQLQRIIQEILSARRVILVIDELHLLAQTAGAEGSIDAAQLFKPLLARGEFRCIGATTGEEYRRWIEADPALERRFQPLFIPETTGEETLEILRGLRARYAEFHRVTITDEALLAAVQMSSRYILNRCQPDKAIDLLDEAAAYAVVRACVVPGPVRALRDALTGARTAKESAIDARDFVTASRQRNLETKLRRQLGELEGQGCIAQAEQRPLVGEQEIARVVAARTAIPVLQIAAAEAGHLLRLEETLHRRVIGQHAAVQAVARAVRRARTNVRDGRRPIGSFMFIGPTGVGKTELARALAAALFDDERALLRLDMSGFMALHHVASLLGPPPGYSGYAESARLTEAMRRRPYSVILFDAIEKAHPRVFDLLLQILEDGRITDSHGRVIDFRHTLVILSACIDASRLDWRDSAPLGVMLPLRQLFKPELLNRIDEVVPFHPLAASHLREIVDLMVGQTRQRLQEQNIVLQVSDEARDLLVRRGADPLSGARALRRTVQRLLEDMLAEAILHAAISPGDTVFVSAASADLMARVESSPRPAPADQRACVSTS